MKPAKKTQSTVSGTRRSKPKVTASSSGVPIYTAIFDRSPFALTLTKMPQATLVNVNDAFLKLFGFTRDEVIGKTSPELVIIDADSRAAVSAELQKSGFVHEYECRRRTKSGTDLMISISLDWVVLEGEKFILTTIRDITAQKKAEQTLSALTLKAETDHQRLLAMLEALPVGMAILDAQGGNIHGNRAFEQIWGSPRPTVDGVKGYSAYKAWWVDSDQPVLPEEWASAQAVQKGKTVTGQLMKIQRFDGTFAYVLNSAAPTYDSQGHVTGCAVAIQDISDLKRHEDEVRQLNCTLKALSNSNQAMLHATSETEFLDQVCRIIIDDCGFTMVWIGFVQNDQRKSVKPVASAGFEQGYLEALDIALEDPQRGQGPTGVAIRTRQPARCNNMLTDPRFSPWRKAALERGYASSIVLPLLSGEQAFGAINIYSRQSDGFSDEEEKLLVKLAGDLSYGITTLRLREERDRFDDALARSEKRYRTLFDYMTEGFALHEIICDEQGMPCDYRFLEINPSFERLTGLKRDQAIGKLASQVLPSPEPFWVEAFGKVALSGQPVQFEHYTEALGRHYQIYAYQPAPRQFATIFMDITERKQVEHALNQVHDELEHRVQTRTQELDIANNQLRTEIAERQKAEADLQTNVEELQVTEEELRNNNESLLDSQKILEEERQRYRDLFELAPDAYLVTDKNGSILDANQYSSILLAVSHNYLIGKPLIVFITQDDRPVFMRLLATVTSQQTMQSQEIRIVPRHGTVITAACRVTFAKDRDGANTVRWTIRDISERKRSEELIRQNSLRNAVLSEVSQSLADASLDEKAILGMVAKTAVRLVGDGCIITLASADGNWLEPAAVSHKRPEVLEMMTSLYGATHNPVTAGLFGQVYQSSKPMLVKELTPGQAEENVPAQYHQYRDSVGISSLLIVPVQLREKTIGTLGLMRDRGSQPYTEDDQSMLELLASRIGQAIHNARLYQELQASLRKELETHDQLVQAEKFAAVGRLLASITHEINNPLQTIKNCLYLSQLDIQPGTPAYETLAIASTETNRLSNLVAQLREMYRPPTRGLNKPVDLPTLVDEVKVLLASYLQDKQVRWEVISPEDDLFDHMKVEGVADQLKQVFLNISLNAIDAMETKGGNLNISFKVNPHANQVGVCFHDTGPGLPDQVKEKLFEPFTTTKEKGLGLGLVICYDIIQKHNGHIDVDSEPGKGAEFTIWLPARRE